MNKLICILFAATLSLGTYSAFAATAGTDEASDLGNSDTPQQMDQEKDKAMKHDSMAHKGTMKHHRMRHHSNKTNGDSTDTLSTGVTTENKVQPSEPNNAAPVPPAQQ